MKNFQPGGLRNRRDDIGGRPRSDANNYAPKNRNAGFGNKPSAERNNAKGRFGTERPGANRFGHDRDKRVMQMFSAVCATCGKNCEVPFKPDGSKPVLCSACYSSQSPVRHDTQDRDRLTTREYRPAATGVKNNPPLFTKSDYDMLTKQLAALEQKVGQILELLSASQKIVTAMPVVDEENESASKPIAAVETSADKQVVKTKKLASPKKAKATQKSVTKKPTKAVAKKVSTKVSKK